MLDNAFDKPTKHLVQSCMSFTEKIVVAKISAKVMHSIKVMQSKDII